MDGLPRAVELPDDVLRLILDDFDLSQLREAAKVSRAWRAVALAHPTYSRNVSLKISPTSYYANQKSDAVLPELAVFRHRLTVSNALGNILVLALSLDVRQYRLRDLDWKMIFTLMRPCVERLAFLSLRVNECFLKAAGAMISCPAPRIVEFCFHVQELSRASKPHLMRNDLFSGHAPLLQKLCLHGYVLSLPPTSGSTESKKWAASPIMALAQVKEVKLELEDSRNRRTHKIIHLERFFVHCPQLERLVVLGRGGYSGASLSSAQSWSALPPAHTVKLRHLSHLGEVVPDLAELLDPNIGAWTRDATAVVSAFVHAQMETLEVNTLSTTGPTLAFILSHFGSDPLHLSASTTSGEYMPLTLRSISRACTRTFMHSFCKTDIVDIPLFRSHLLPLAAQIVHLTVHRMYVAWDFVAMLFDGIGALPSVTHLSVALGLTGGDMRNEYYRNRDLTHKEHCCFHPNVRSLDLPALERVELVGPADAPLRAEDVALLMGKGLRRAARRDLVLVLNGVQIEGDLNLIWGYFDRIELHLGDV